MQTHKHMAKLLADVYKRNSKHDIVVEMRLSESTTSDRVRWPRLLGVCSGVGKLPLGYDGRRSSWSRSRFSTALTG